MNAWQIRLWLLLLYLSMPFDLISRHWPGSEDGLHALWRVAGLPGEPVARHPAD